MSIKINSSNTLNYRDIKMFPEVICFDSNEDAGIELYCYDLAIKNASPFVKECRGNIYEKETGKLLVRSLGYSPDFTKDDESEVFVQYFSNFDPKDCKIFESREGCFLRLFNYKGNWYLSTHKKLDANKSRWGASPSFGEIFDSSLMELYNNRVSFRDAIIEKSNEVLETPTLSNIRKLFCMCLENDKVYTFLLENTISNRIVCSNRVHPNVYSVGYFKEDEFCFSSILGLPTTKELELNSWNELYSYVDNIDYLDHQGVIVFFPDSRIIKILNKTYKELMELRGNCPNIRFRYLQIRNDPEKRIAFGRMYNEHYLDFCKVERCINHVASLIHKAYISRFINKQYTVVHPALYNVITIVHGKHIADRTYIVTLDKITDCINNLSAPELNTILNLYIDFM